MLDAQVETKARVMRPRSEGRNRGQGQLFMAKARSKVKGRTKKVAVTLREFMFRREVGLSFF